MFASMPHGTDGTVERRLGLCRGVEASRHFRKVADCQTAGDDNYVAQP